MRNIVSRKLKKIINVSYKNVTNSGSKIKYFIKKSCCTNSHFISKLCILTILFTLPEKFKLQYTQNKKIISLNVLYFIIHSKTNFN